MCRLRSLKCLLLMVAALSVVADTTVFGAVRRSSRGYRPSRTSRTTRTTSRPNPLAGAAANVQRALAALNAARVEQSAATGNLVRARKSAEGRYDNTAKIEPVREDFNKAEAAHEAAKEEVLDRLKQNDAGYKAARAKLDADAAQLKKVQFTGPQSAEAALKKDVRDQRLAVSALEAAALQKDGSAQAAQRERDAATQRIQALRRETETAISRDSDLNGAKSKAAQAATKVNAASSNYSRAVASANAAAQAARAQAAAQAMRPRYSSAGRSYGRGGYSRGRSHGYSRSSVSRFRRYR